MKLSQRIARWLLLDVWGWKVSGPLPYDTPKCVVVVYPHTSNWDFPIGVLFRPAFQLDVDFVAKHSLFKGPLGPIMRALGGKPVVRVGNTKFVEAVASVFAKESRMRLCVTPEGTRSRVDQLKTGFHHMARLAGVPIIWCAFDWANKHMVWSEPFWPDDNYDRTVAAFHDFFRGYEGYHPDLQYPIPPSQLPG